MVRALLSGPAMIAIARTATLLGVEAREIEVEVELAPGLPVLSLIGLGDAAIQEARYRIQAAIRSAGLELPHKKITINLAPADLRKDGASLDLPMALALLAGAGHVPVESVEQTLAIGELALTGALRPIRGALAVAALARSKNMRAVIVPPANADEAAAVEGIEVWAPRTFAELIAHLRGELSLPVHRPARSAPAPRATPDLSEVRGQTVARRALEIAAAGAHNLLLIGPPGSGKTMLARRLPGILPPLDPGEAIEVTRVWSAAGLTTGGGLITDRPFRAPHHTLSEIALVGGGSPIRPGEVSLAHQGVLFLDELPELPRRVIEALRVPLEDRALSISRIRHTARLPAAFMLVGAANPCPCGWAGDKSGRCACDPEQIRRYFSRISGPILDRIDLVVDVPAVDARALMSGDPGEPSREVAARVAQARARVGEDLALTSEARALLERAIERLKLSARSVERVLKVSRTIATLAERGELTTVDVAEALRYRPVGGVGGRSERDAA